jgi:hypothetical protein
LPNDLVRDFGTESYESIMHRHFVRLFSSVITCFTS